MPQNTFLKIKYEYARINKIASKFIKVEPILRLLITRFWVRFPGGSENKAESDKSPPAL
jgi:hypothetical protein